MKKVFALIIACVFMVCSGAAAFAANEGASAGDKIPAQYSNERVKEMAQDFGLTPAQQAQISAVFEEAAKKELKLREEREQIVRDAAQKVRTFLTPEQLKKLDSKRNKKKTSWK